MADFSRAMRMLASKKGLRRVNKQKEPFDRASRMDKMDAADKARMRAVDRANRRLKKKKKY